MWRLQWTPDRAGILWLLASAIVAIAIFAVALGYSSIQQRNAGAGFGPDWDCTPQPKGEPICIKKIGR